MGLKKIAFFGQLLLLLVWVILIYPGMTSWRDSIPFIVFMSLYTIILEHANLVYNSWLAMKQK